MNDASETLHEIYNCLHSALCTHPGRPMEAGLPAGVARSGLSKSARRRGVERTKAGVFESEATGASMARARPRTRLPL